MKRKILTARGGLIALLVFMLSLCFAFGVWLAAPVFARAAEDGNAPAAQPAADAPARLPNKWLVTPSVLSWAYGSYDSTVNFITAVPEYGAENLRFMIKSERENTWVVFGNDANGNPVLSFTTADLKDKESGSYEERVTAVNKVLYNLPAGTYYLIATVSGTSEYEGINDGIIEIGENAEGVYKFNVLKAENGWKTTPNVVQWTWKNYKKSVNLINAVPAFPENPQDADVKFSVYTDPSCYEGSLYNSVLKEFSAPGGLVSSAVELVLKDLPAGTYYLKAYQAGSEDYEFASSVVQFKVFTAQNYWKTTPNVVQWTWGEYNTDINIVSAEPAYGGIEDVDYSIYSDEHCNEIVCEEFSFTKVINPVSDSEFEISYVVEGGVEFLAELHAGTYYLKAVLPADEGNNYTSLSSVVSFRIQRMQNHWAVTPSIIAWQYGEYNEKVNSIQALPSFGGWALISLYHANGEPVLFNNGTIVNYFSLEYQNGVFIVPEYVQSVLKELSVGTYYMLASVLANEHGDYTGLNNYASFEDVKTYGIEFEITAAQNGWIKIPKIMSWSEGHYDSEVNQITAEAMKGNDKMIIYVIDESGRIITSNAGGNELDYDLISKLGVGSYTVRFVINGTDNYSKLEGETTFAVFEDSVGLTGIIAAVIVFAILDVFAAGACITLLVFRRKKIEAAYRTMIQKELYRR